MTRVIELDSTLYKDMVAQGLEEFPNEACGLLASADGSPVKAFRMTNSDASPVSYRLDGKEQLQAFNEMDDEGWELHTIYHTHTHSEAYPSETDRKQAFYPDAYYMVMSLSDRENPELRAFTIRDGEIAEEEVKVVEPR
jgi:proteasome lid subunit RPN8/RPN11